MRQYKDNRYNPRVSIPGNQVAVWRSGAATFARMVDWINTARYEVQLQTYIFVADQTGAIVSDALIRAAKRGVKVYVMLDAYGSLELMRNSAWTESWQAAGIVLKWFGRPFTGENINLGRRLHYKLLIIDGQNSLVGGFNIADRYNDLPGQPAWLDFGIQVKGPMTMHLRQVANRFWRNDPETPVALPAWANLEPVGEVPVRLLQNDWLRGVYELNTEYRHAFYHAEEEIIIVGAYFTPGRRIRNSLLQAIQQGAQVRVILSQQNDVWIAKYATRYLYRWMLRYQIQIYEWPTTVVHGKVAVVDSYWATIGSYNLNFLSAYESIELNYVVQHAPTTASIRQQLLQIIDEECSLFTQDDFNRTHSVWGQFKEWLAYRLFRFMTRMLLLTGRRKSSMRH